MNAMTEFNKHYLAEFNWLNSAPSQAPWIKQVREKAFVSFMEQGFPTTRHEDWKYTSVAAVEKTAFAPAAADIVVAELPAIFAFSDLACHQLVFVNGHYSPAHSRLLPLPAGVRIASLAAVLAEENEVLEQHLFRHTDYREHAFTALNTALATDGAYVYLPPDAVIAEPVHLLFVATAGEKSLMTHPRNLIVAGENSQATIIEHYVSMGESEYFTNAVTELLAGRNAAIEHIKLQEESRKAFHIATLQVYQEANSRFASHSVSLGAALARNDINSVLDAERAECTLNGLYLADGSQHVDCHTRVDHAKPHGTSRELYKGVLDGRARGVFNGKVFVHHDAQKTDAQQSNKNLLLSRDAEVDTKPQMEIYADDVKCSHGATVGQLDENMIFYLRSRGIGEAAARSLLTYAFATDVLNHITLPSVRRNLETKLLARLPEGQKLEEFYHERS